MTSIEKKALQIHYFLIGLTIVLAVSLVWELGYESKRLAGGWMKMGSGDYGALKQINQDVNLMENKNGYTVVCRIPETDRDNIEVFLAGKYLAINVSNDYAAGEKDGMNTGNRRHKILIPGPVRGEDIRAQYNNGVLTITLPKKKLKDDLEPLEVQVI